MPAVDSYSHRRCHVSTNRRLKAARMLLGLSQIELAERIGRKELDISRIETGRTRPDEVTKRRIAEVLKKSTYELFDC